ncbi:TPA: hypothetical protein DF272_00375 [Candidatus Falkowbacteria bacterium]|nr:hypothetical protein [Candidatus Falkowbacteria bacterium]
MSSETLSTTLSVLLYIAITLGALTFLRDKIKNTLLCIIVAAGVAYPLLLLAKVALFIVLAGLIGYGSYTLIKDHIESLPLRLLATVVISIATYFLFKLLFALIAWLLPAILLVLSVIFVYRLFFAPKN